MIQTAIL